MTAACPAPRANSRAALKRRASNAATSRRPCRVLAMPQHGIVPDDDHQSITRESLARPCAASPRDLVLEVGREVTAVALLQGPLLPVLARERPPAASCPTGATRPRRDVFLHRPVVGELFSGLDASEGDEGKLSPEAEVRLARVIEVNLVPPDFRRAGRADVEAVVDLDVGAADPPPYLRERPPVQDVAALDGHDLALADGPGGEETPAMYRASSDSGFRREVRGRHSRLCSAAYAALFDFEDHLDLDGDAHGQLGHAHRRAGVPAVFAEDFDHEVREDVDHLGLVAEALGRVDHTQHLDD